MRRVLCVALCTTTLFSVSRADDKAAPGQVQIASVQIDKLVEAFQTNEINAVMVYRDKEFSFSGRVVRVITSRFGFPELARGKRAYVIELQTKPLDLSRVSVQCFFDETERDRLVNLTPGQEVIILGTCQRPLIYTGDYKRNEKDYTELRFYDCRLMEPK